MGDFIKFDNSGQLPELLKLLKLARSAKVEIRNETGQKMLETKIERISRETTRFDVSSFSPGIYMISIQVDETKPMVQCFIVTD